MSLLPLNRMLLLAVLLLAPLSAGADDTPPAEREAAAAFEERMARCVSSLSSPELEVRRAAIQEMIEAGIAALPALEEGAANSQRERSLACFNLMQRLVNTDDEETSTLALEAVRRLSESEDGGVAGRANSILAAVAATEESTAVAMLEASGCRIHRGRMGEISYVSGIESDRELALLKSITSGGISTLSMSGPQITDKGMKHLADVPAVRSLSIQRSSITDAGLKTLSELRNVDSLILGSGNYTAEGLRELGMTSRFRSLMMRDVAPEHLPVLGEIPQLQTLYLDNLQLSGTEVRLLNELDGVNVSLDLDEATDEDLQQVSQLQSLRTLDINPRNTVTDAGMANLSGLSLERLTINAPQLTDDAFQHIGNITTLEMLSLRDMQVSDSGLEHLRGLDNLRLFLLHRTNVTDEGLQRLREALPGLRLLGDFQNQLVAPRPAVRPPVLTDRERELDQKLARILTEEEQEALRQLTVRNQLRSRVGVTVSEATGLVTLFVRRSLTDDDTQQLRRISKIGTVSLGDSASDEDMKRLQGVGMRRIFASRAPISDAGLAALTNCPNLQSLSLAESNVTDAGLAHLAELPNLIELSLRSVAVTDSGLAQLGKLDRLTGLSLADCNGVTDDGIRHLSGLVNLDNLSLAGMDGLTSTSLVHLTELPDLKTLYLHELQLEQQDLVHVASLAKLETLTISSSNLTDDGLRYVSRIPVLKELNISRTQVTDAGLATSGWSTTP